MIVHHRHRFGRIINNLAVEVDDRNADIMGKQGCGPGIIIRTGDDVGISFKTRGQDVRLVAVRTAQLHDRHHGRKDREDRDNPFP